MKQMIVERLMSEPNNKLGKAPIRSQHVNLAESPLSWLWARKLINERQFFAGEKLRTDFENAGLSARVTMQWDMIPRSQLSGSVDPEGPARFRIEAHKHFDAALEAAGRGFVDILWRTVCACEALPQAEKALGWPTRSAKLVLSLALDRLADHYRLPDA